MTYSREFIDISNAPCADSKIWDAYSCLTALRFMISGTSYSAIDVIMTPEVWIFRHVAQNRRVNPVLRTTGPHFSVNWFTRFSKGAGGCAWPAPESFTWHRSTISKGSLPVAFASSSGKWWVAPPSPHENQLQKRYGTCLMYVQAHQVSIYLRGHGVCCSVQLPGATCCCTITRT